MSAVCIHTQACIYAHIHSKGSGPLMCVCVAKPVAVELRCHATALISYVNMHFAYAKSKSADQLRGNHAADQRLCFLYTIYFLNLKFQASSHLLWLYSPVCVGMVENPGQVFLQHGSNPDTRPSHLHFAKAKQMVVSDTHHNM